MNKNLVCAFCIAERFVCKVFRQVCLRLFHLIILYIKSGVQLQYKSTSSSPQPKSQFLPAQSTAVCHIRRSCPFPSLDIKTTPLDEAISFTTQAATRLHHVLASYTTGRCPDSVERVDNVTRQRDTLAASSRRPPTPRSRRPACR